ncbi:MAG: N-acetylneuraminate synthase [Planctomycetota bacterium]|nr:MAG: N-acetylneuraminate synthase [Planctomycetota bacterium]
MSDFFETYKLNSEYGPVMVIAEIGVNHNGDLDRAKKMVLKANQIGANAVKFQMFRPEALATAKAEMWDSGYGPGQQLDMLRKLALSPEEFTDLKRFTDQVGIEFLASVFDHDSLRHLVELGVRAVKLGSCEITNEPLLTAAAKTGLPILLSTGASDLEETKRAVEVLREAGANAIVLMHCVSHYPATLDDANVLAVKTLRKEFDYPIGYSDHTTGFSAVLGAVALGARVIEKHFTLSKYDIGPDHEASADVDEFKDIVQKIRNLERALGHGVKKWAPSEEPTRRLARKSLVALEVIKKGTKLSRDIVAIKRPGTGVPPKYYKEIGNYTAACDIEADETITWDMLEKRMKDEV